MPDIYGFDHLGQSMIVACIDCPERGLLVRWPEWRRKRHARSHARARAESAAKAKEELDTITNGESLDQ